MNDKLKASVIIPYYNAGKYIDETLVSLFAQTVLPMEVIIVDDGSSDKYSLDRLSEIENKYNVTVLHKENGGISSALNFGAKKAMGDIIFQLDSDDILDKTYIEEFLHIFERETGVDGVTCGYKMFYDGVDILDETNFHRKYMPEGLVQPKIFFENCAGGSNGAFRRSALEKIEFWDESFTSFQDWGLWLRFLQYDLKQKIVSKYLYSYRVRKEGDLQKESIMTEVQKKILKYKCAIEQKDCTNYAVEKYQNEKKEFYKNQKITVDKNNLLQNNFSSKRVRQLWREFVLCAKREGAVSALRRSVSFLKYGRGKK